jgi:hypothetical protein
MQGERPGNLAAPKEAKCRGKLVLFFFPTQGDYHGDEE